MLSNQQVTRLRPLPVVRYLLCTLVVLTLPIAVTASPSDHGLSLQPTPSIEPTLLGPTPFPFQLILDDGSAESVFGFGGGTARQFAWLNRFASPGPFLLEEVWVLFPAGQDVPAAGAIQLAVYQDDNTDLADGAELLATYDDVIQFNDGATFSVYSLSPPVTLSGDGDVILGVINRYFLTGIDPPPTFPAAVDTTTNQGGSYFALWAGDPPNPPQLATAANIEALAGATAGNFLIRGFGSEPPVLVVPTLKWTGLALLIGLLGVFGAFLSRRV